MLQVMVIDMLEGFTRIGPLASERVNALVPRQKSFLQTLPEGSLVLFLADEHDEADFELKRFPAHCLRGTREAELRQELVGAARQSGARIEIVRKHEFSGFVGTNLDEIISSAPSRCWVVIGCVTDCCIEANVAELVYRGYEVKVVRDLVDTWDLSPAAARQAGLDTAYDAERINEHWFAHRLPAIWGVRVVKHWQELTPQARSDD